MTVQENPQALHTAASGLRVLAVDDVPAALDDLCSLLREAPEVGSVTAAGDPLAALKSIRGGEYDAVFLDIAMPGLDGLELGELLRKLASPPVIVFVTAYDEHAVAAFGIGAVDYLLKPVRAERLAETLGRVARMAHADEPSGRPSAEAQVPDARVSNSMAALPVEVGGRTRYVQRGEVRFVEAHGDYVRLHAPSGVHLVRMPISRLEEYWEGAGFVRTHRGFLVALSAVRELRSDSVGGLLAHTDVGDVPVSRRHARQLRQRLLEAAQQGELERPT
ncbi:LytR/AlgR family response regulator transcription factor [Prauserella rugosa]|uniref:LytTR family two component transcriptional regulator n=1 Tax=Prauserella rugosa TaxID=43354 RepID=A0A660CA13_9PSEU|nr:LytTR family DNA-binding domain-containing protein [Prauserella rugosa]KID30560.1 two component transcriptional regulator, LytTR family [Prauserella sp. Am3]KMS82257.1 LytR family transcriptional regulator [Streptomyces regensis]TWH20146.1 LytTR family two component transcriptional regulator [Prauserella rugosa]